MGTKPLATSLDAVNPGTAGATRPGALVGRQRSPERDANAAKVNPKGKGIARKSGSASSARNQALVNIGTARRIGKMAGSASPMPTSAHLGKSLPAHNTAI